MQIGRFGLVQNEGAVARAQEEFRRRESAVLEAFLAPDLAIRFVRALSGEECAPSVHHLEDRREFGRDLTFAPTSPTLHGLHLLLNDASLFAAVRAITGCGRIGCFAGRIYRNLPTPDYHLDWHDDTQIPGRLIGLSISLTDGWAVGGEFQIRRKSTREILACIPHSVAGNAHIFRIDPTLEHLVAPVAGNIARTAFAGWFQSAPDSRTFVRSMFAEPDV